MAISFAEHVEAARSTTTGDDETLTSCAEKQRSKGTNEWMNILAMVNLKEPPVDFCTAPTVYIF